MCLGLGLGFSPCELDPCFLDARFLQEEELEGSSLKNITADTHAPMTKSENLWPGRAERHKNLRTALEAQRSKGLSPNSDFSHE